MALTHSTSKESHSHATRSFFGDRSGSLRPFFAPMIQAKCATCAEEETLQRCACKDEAPTLQRCACHGEAPKLQTKLTIGAPGDRYEHEADSMADAVMRTAAPDALMSSAGTQLQRMPISPVTASLLQREATESCDAKDEPKEEGEEENEETEDEEPTEAKQVSPKRHPGEVSPPPDLESRLDASRGGGSSLPATTREFMESRFGHDFSDVRVHTGSSSEQLNRDVRSLAFTSGSDIYFGSGQYRPDTSSGQNLLAHELTHVVQQSGAGNNGPVREKADPNVIRRAELPEYKWYYGHRVSGESVHNILGNILHKANPDGLVTEAAIAGANRNFEGLNKIGRADLYQSTPARTVTGVKAYKDLDSEDDVVSMNSPEVQRTRPLDKVTSSPTFTKSTKTWRGNFPTEILLGEIKPWNTLMAADGMAQLDHYQQGYSKFVEKLSKVNKGKTRPSIKFGRLNLTMPAWLDFDNWEAQKANEVGAKPATINDRRLWVAKLNPGVYLYTDFARKYTGPPPELFTKHLTEMRTVRDGLKNVKHPRTDPLGQGKFIQRGSTKDRSGTYWADQGRAWETKRSAFAKPFRAGLKSSLKGWREKARFEKRLGRSGRSQSANEKSEVKDYKSLMFWSGIWGRLLGKIRFLLGSAWDKVLTVFEKMKEKMAGIRSKVKAIEEGTIVKSGWAQQLIKVVVAACKVAFSSFITESFNFFVDCFQSAMDKVLEKITDEINEKFGKQICEVRKLFESVKAEIEDRWGGAIKMIEDLVAAVQEVKYWMDIATTAVDLIRIGVQLISCLSPPGLGCLWGLVAQLGIGTMVGLVIGTQWFADNIVTPNVRKLVRKYIAPYYQTLINDALGPGLSDYHCHIADDPIPSMNFTAKAEIPDSALREHRDKWEAEFAPEILRDLQQVFGKPGGKKPTKEELLELLKKIKESGLSMQEFKDRQTMQALLQQSLDPKSGKLNIEEAKKQAEKTEAPAPVAQERKIDYPNARKQNVIYQKMRGWDPTQFVKKPGIKVDSDEFADAVYDLQKALKVKADGIAGDDTLIAFYDQNKLKKDIFYKESEQAIAAAKAAEEERKKKAEDKAAADKAAADKAAADKAAADKAAAAPKLPASVKVVNGSTVIPNDRNQVVQHGVGVYLVDFWNLVERSDSPRKSFKARSSPPFVSLDVYVDSKHEFRIENVAVKQFAVVTRFGYSCYWTATLDMENGFEIQTSKGKIELFYLEWCVSPD